MGGELEDPVAAGRRASAAGNWEEAEAAFRAALAERESGRALEGVGDALWWQGRIQDCMEHRERAYAAYLREARPWGAARCALSLATDHRDSCGNAAAASGWRRRARRLVDEHGIEALRGWVLLSESIATTDPGDGLDRARQALDCARDRGDTDLELAALAQIGARLIGRGELDAGLAHLDEAMAAVLGSGGPRPGTTVMASCTALEAGTTGAAFERVTQWVRGADRFIERYGCPFLHVDCRSLYGAALLATGDWTGAELELLAAVDASEGAFPAVRARALATLAELRLAQGRVEEAERLVAGLEGGPRVAQAVARVHLACDRPAAAEAVLRRWLTELGEDGVAAHELVESLGEAELAQGRADAAAERGDALVAFSHRQGGPDVTRARGERLRGRAQLVTSGGKGARPHLDTALVAFERLGMPFDAARTRLLLTEALRPTEPEAAIAEARAALEVSDALGARPLADAAASVLRELGVRAARGAAPGDGHLTGRETEVLGLLGEGLSNPEIGERLYISRKTVEHHVTRVLAKLGLRSRTEAAAEAARRGAAASTRPPGAQG